MSAPTEQNRLEGEASPYLQAHADNPVNWQPWDDTALEAAREQDVPIFLSIGYAACHWCHVMAEESFEDESIARRLNEDFVPIKLDREERPDIDTIYMTICQVVNRAGCGWPLSVWLTPEGHPFFIGTYFPKESKQGQPGFGQLLERLSHQWETERDDLESRARQWMQAGKAQLESTPEATRPDTGSSSGTDLLESAAEGLLRRADREHGGFGSGQKFPQPGRLSLLALASDRTDLDQAAPVLTETLDAIVEGGLRDQLGGGFHRYCVDPEWTVPHFEKMLYDNATIPKALLHGYQVTGKSRYANIAAETFDFVERELTHEDGGFYSTLDARSPDPADPKRNEIGGHNRGVEGAYYVWTPKQVHQAIAEAAAETAAEPTEGRMSADPDLLTEVVCERYDITEAGNFEGSTVPTIGASFTELASSFDRSQAEIQAALRRADEWLRSARDKRPRPPRDEKIIAAWNGLMIDALAEGALVLGTERYAEMAQDAMAFVREALWDGEVLNRRYKEPDADGGDSPGAPGSTPTKGPAVLEDYAYLARGTLTLFEATGDLDALCFALELTRAIEREFWDEERGTLYYTPVSGEELPVRPQEVADGSTPSSTGIAVEVLLAMDAVTPAAGFDEMAESVLETHRPTVADTPMQHATMVMASEIQRDGHLEVTISGEGFPDEWRECIGGRFIPDRLIAHRPPDDGTLERWLGALQISETPPIWAERSGEAGATAYVCRRACSPPLQDVPDLEEWIDRFAG